MLRIYIIIGVMLFSGTLNGQSFCSGFEAGWDRTMEGAGKYIISPACPTPDLSIGYNESDYSHGFRTGVARATNVLNAQRNGQASSSKQSNNGRGVIELPDFAEIAYQRKLNDPNYSADTEISALGWMVLGFMVLVPVMTILILANG